MSNPQADDPGRPVTARPGLTLGEIVVLALVGVSIILVAAFWSQMPASMASHWDATGEVDGYASRDLMLILMPAIMLVAALLFLAIPRIDPLKQNIARFRASFDWFMVTLLLFLLFLELQVIIWNLGVRVSMAVTMPVAIGVVVFVAGLMLGRAKRNYTVGIRTPWTLHSDQVWDRTHRFAGILFRIAGGLLVLCALLGRYAFLFVLTIVLGVTLVVVVYSYLEHRRAEADGVGRK